MTGDGSAAGGRTRRLSPRIAAAAVVMLVGGLIAAISLARPEPAPSAEPPFRVTVSRGTRAMSFTSRESGALSRCRVAMLDAGEPEWTAAVDGTVAPGQAVTIAWSAFTINDQPMPDHIGQARHDIVVSCFLDDEGNTHSARLEFPGRRPQE